MSDILALDLSLTRTGWAHSHNDGAAVIYGATSFPILDKEFPCARYSDFAYWLEMRIKIARPDLVVFEENTSHGRHGTDALVMLKMRTLEICAKHRIPTKSLFPNHLKKFTTGDGNADKEAMQTVIKGFFPHYVREKDDGGDIADSLAMIRWGLVGCPPSDAEMKRNEQKAKKSKRAAAQPLPEKKPRKTKAKVNL